MTDESLAQIVIEELHRAECIHKPIKSHHEGYAIILEEVEELWECIKRKKYKQTAVEARQVAAMGLRFLKDLYT